MSLPPTVVHAARHTGAAVAFNVTNRNARAMRAQGIGVEIVCWMTQGKMALYLGNEALEILGRPMLPSVHPWAPLVISLVLVGTERLLPAGYAKATVGFLKSAAGMMLRASMLVSQIAVVYFTGSVTAIAILSYLAIDELHVRKLLSSRVSAVYQSSVWPLSFGLAAVAQGTWSALGWFMAGQYVVPTLILWALSKQPDPGKNIGQLTPALLQDILQKDNPFPDFEINQAHLAWAPLPAQPNVEFSELIDLWEGIRWEKYPARPTDPNIPPPVNPQAQLKKFVQILEDDDQSLPSHRYEAKIVIDYLQYTASEAERAKFLAELAACSPRSFQGKISNLSDRIISGSQPVSLRTGILYFLQEIRTNHQNLGLSDLIESLRRSRHPMDAGACYGWIRHEHETVQLALPVQALFKCLEKGLEWAGKGDLEKSGYVSNKIAEYVKMGYGDSPLARAWWYELLCQQSDENKNKFLQLLAGNQLLEEKSAFHIEINEKVILAMLFEMGIVQRKTTLAAQVPERVGSVAPISPQVQLITPPCK